MKKWLVVALWSLVIPAVVLAGSNAVVTLWGDSGPTYKTTLTDTARTLDNVVVTAGGITKKNGVYPVGAYLTVETQAARIGMGGTTPTVDNVGHVIAAGGSLHVLGASPVGSLKFVNESAGDNAVLQITLQY